MIELTPRTYYLGDPPSDPKAGLTGQGTAVAAAAEPIYTRGTLYEKHGTATNKIVVCGPRTAIIDGSDKVRYKHAGFLIVKCSHVVLAGITFQYVYKGIDIQNSHHVTVYGCKTRFTLQEGIRLRFGSQYNKIHYNRVLATGLEYYGTGEGLYIGTSDSQSVKAGLGPDRSDYNEIFSNKFGPGVTAENIDAKEYTTGNKIYNNRFDGSGIKGVNSAYSFIAIKGNGYKVYDNTGQFAPPGGGVGYRVANLVPGQGQYNLLENNECTRFPDLAYCVYLGGGTANNVVKCVKTPDGGKKCNCNVSGVCTSSIGVASGTTPTTFTPNKTLDAMLAYEDDMHRLSSHMRIF